MRHAVRPSLVLLLAGGLAMAGPVRAADVPETEAEAEAENVSEAAPESGRNRLLGLALSSSRPHIGSEAQSLDAQPLWAFQYGSLRIASGRAGSLMSAGRETVDPGVSTVLVTDGGWRLSTSLRYDGGRSEDDADPLLRGLPGLRETVRGRLSASRALGPRWSLGLGADQDLLGRGGGLRLNAGTGYRYPLSGHTQWDLSVGVGWGNSTYLQSRYGIGAEAAASSGRPAYLLGSGWESLGLGLQLTSVLGPHWVAFGGLSVNHLLGEAARSPLVGRRTVYGASVGLAWRSRP